MLNPFDLLRSVLEIDQIKTGLKTNPSVETEKSKGGIYIYVRIHSELLIKSARWLVKDKVTKKLNETFIKVRLYI